MTISLVFFTLYDLNLTVEHIPFPFKAVGIRTLARKMTSFRFLEKVMLLLYHSSSSAFFTRILLELCITRPFWRNRRTSVKIEPEALVSESECDALTSIPRWLLKRHTVLGANLVKVQLKWKS